MAAPMDDAILSLISTENLKCLRKTKSNILSFDEIGTVDYQTFFENHLLANKPCIFTPEVTKDWKSRKEWVSDDNNPNFNNLRTKFGDAKVPVANCKQEQYSSHPKQDMTLNEFLDYWEKYRESGYPSDEPCLYLKDWHFTRDFPDYEAYSTPIYFRSDWLNEFWDTLPQDDYRFVYMGPKGTWTPFHADVYRSYSWSANICGKKRWIFYPPGCEENLKDNLGNLVYDVTSLEGDNLKKFPNAHKVKGQMLEVIQGQGQIIFVPSGWHHQVFNLEDTISINHNWLNGCNIDICWRHVQDALMDVKNEIGNCRDMDGWNAQCQLILKACSGIDYLEFVRMLRVIAENRVKQYLKYQQGQSQSARLTTGTDENCSGGARLENDKPPVEHVQRENTTDRECERSGLIKLVGKKFEDVKLGRKYEKQDHQSCKDCDLLKDETFEHNFEEKSDYKFEVLEVKCENCESKRENSVKEYAKCESLMDCIETSDLKSENSNIIRPSCRNEEQCICEKSLDCSQWTDRIFLLFDIDRIRETLQDIIVDEDYLCLEKSDIESAENVFKLLNHL